MIGLACAYTGGAYAASAASLNLTTQFCLPRQFAFTSAFAHLKYITSTAYVTLVVNIQYVNGTLVVQEKEAPMMFWTTGRFISVECCELPNNSKDNLCDSWERDDCKTRPKEPVVELLSVDATRKPADLLVQMKCTFSFQVFLFLFKSLQAPISSK